MVTALHNCILLTGKETLNNKAVLVRDGMITGIISEEEIPSDAKSVNLNDNYLAPGFIDLQIYGSGRKLFGGKPTVEALEQMETDLLKHGCTGFLATVATNSDQVVDQAIEAAKAYRPKAKGNFLGLHLEGPYLNAERKGAHPEKFIKKATLAEIKGWLEHAEGEIKMMTLAPELQDSEIITYLHTKGIVLSVGHSNASYDEAMQFLSNGITAATHLYNAMPTIHHREPGLIPAIFEKKPYSSVVADGIHVSFPMIDLAKRELMDKLFLITDAVTETNEGIYPHILAGNKYTMPDGTLSGSNLTMIAAVKNCVIHTRIKLEEAVRMASTYPAKVIGLEQQMGYIAPQYQANFIVFTKDFEVQQTWLKGILC